MLCHEHQTKHIVLLQTIAYSCCVIMNRTINVKYSLKTSGSLWLWYKSGLIAIAGKHLSLLMRSCMNMLERKIWKSSIRLETKLRLYQTYIVPVLMYGFWWVDELGHHKVPALSPRCIWHMGTTQDLEDTVYSPCVKCGSQKNHWLFTALSPGD